MIRRPPRSKLFPYPSLFRSKTRTKRLQYQVNFRSDMRPEDDRDAGPFPVVDVVAEAATSTTGNGPASRSSSGRMSLRKLTWYRSEEHTAELQSPSDLDSRLH